MDPEFADDESEPLPQPIDEHLETILDLPCELRRRLVATARRLIWKYRLAPAGVDAVEAVTIALHRLWKAVKAGRFRELATRNDVEKVLIVILNQFLLDELKRQRRR